MTQGLHRWGPDSDATVILLHGWTMTGAIWEPLAERLGLPCLAPDLPGHGAASGHEPTVAGGVAQLDALMQGRQGVTLVGWSLGALIGWDWLAQGGQGVVRMVSLDMSPCPLPAPGWDWPMRGQSADKAARFTRRLREDWPGAARAIAQGMFARPEGAATLPATRAEALIRAQDPDAMARFWESLTRMDLRQQVAGLDLPLLALHGAQSRVYAPETGAWIAAHGRNARTLALPGCGHAPNLEDPGATAAAIAAFIAAG